MKNSTISLDASEAGITRVAIYADSAQEQSQAHLLLTFVATKIRPQDAALRSIVRATERTGKVSEM